MGFHQKRIRLAISTGIFLLVVIVVVVLRISKTASQLAIQNQLPESIVNSPYTGDMELSFGTDEDIEWGDLVNDQSENVFDPTREYISSDLSIKIEPFDTECIPAGGDLSLRIHLINTSDQTILLVDDSLPKMDASITNPTLKFLMFHEDGAFVNSFNSWIEATFGGIDPFAELGGTVQLSRQEELTIDMEMNVPTEEIFGTSNGIFQGLQIQPGNYHARVVYMAMYAGSKDPWLGIVSSNTIVFCIK